MQRPEDDDLNLPSPPLPVGHGSRFNLGNDIKKTVVVSLVVSILVFVGMGMFGGGSFVTKKDFTTNMAEVTAVVSKAKSDMAKIQSDATAAVAKANSDIVVAVASVPTTISTQVSSQINNAVSQWNSQLSSLTAKVEAMSKTIIQTTTDMDDANKAIEALQARATEYEKSITVLEERVTELETPPSSSSSAPFTVESRVVSKLMTYDGATGNSTVSFGIKLVLENTENRDLEDIEIEIPLEVRVYTLTGSGEILVWHDQLSKWYLADMDKGYSTGEGVAYAVLSGTDITLDASEVEKITVPMTMLVKGNVHDFDVEIDDDDIDIVDWGYE